MVLTNPCQFFKLLSDETRLKCLLLIMREQELCVCELVTALQCSQPKMSRHLAMLKQSGLLTDRKQRQWVFYQISAELPFWVKEILLTTNNQCRSFIDGEMTRLSAMGQRPDRTMQCCD